MGDVETTKKGTKKAQTKNRKDGEDGESDLVGAMGFTLLANAVWVGPLVFFTCDTELLRSPSEGGRRMNMVVRRSSQPSIPSTEQILGRERGKKMQIRGLAERELEHTAKHVEQYYADEARNVSYLRRAWE